MCRVGKKCRACEALGARQTKPLGLKYPALDRSFGDPLFTEEREVNPDGTISCGVFVPLPFNLARQFPNKDHEDDSVPHITLLYIGDVDPADYERVVSAVTRVARHWTPFRMEMLTYGEFHNPKGQLIPHMKPRAAGLRTSLLDFRGFENPLGVLHQDLKQAVERLNVPVAHTYGPEGDPNRPDWANFKAHATLDYLPGDATYDGPKPTGSWRVTEIECWGHEKYRIPLGAKVADQPKMSLFDRLIEARTPKKSEEPDDPERAAFEKEREENWKANDEYLKWIHGFSDPWSAKEMLDDHGPTTEEWRIYFDDMLDEAWKKPPGWKPAPKVDQNPGGNDDEALYEKFKGSLNDFEFRFFIDVFKKTKARNLNMSVKQAAIYKKIYDKLMKASDAAGGEAPKEEPKKPFVPSPYQAAIFDWVKDAAQQDQAALVVDAKAGAGKSKTMEEALAFIPPGQKVVFLAFNKDIAESLAKRVRDKKNVEASTINAFGRASVVAAFGQGQKDSPKLEQNKYRILAGQAVEKLAKKKLVAQEYDRAYAYKMADAIQKRRLLATRDESGEIVFPPWEDVLKKFQIDMEFGKKQTNKKITKEQGIAAMEEAFQAGIADTDTMDYTDQVLWPVLHDLPIYSRRTKKKVQLDWAMVDECQDLSPLEREFAKRLAPRHMLVGDPNQSIYAFKGSDPDSMSKMKESLGAEEKPLSICYRCPKAVIKEAQRLVPSIEAAPGAEEGEVKRIPHEKMLATLKPGDFVMCRTNAPNVAAAMTLLAGGKKAVVVGRDIGEALSNLIKKIGGKVKHKTMPIEEFTKKLKAWHTKERKRLIAEKNEHLLDGLDDKRDCIQALMEKPGVATAADLVDAIKSLFVDDPSPAINFSSIHKAKGLEADHCFIQRPDLLPLPAAEGDEIQEQQEKNLEYVAITRAMKTLTWINPPVKEESIQPARAWAVSGLIEDLRHLGVSW